MKNGNDITILLYEVMAKRETKKRKMEFPLPTSWVKENETGSLKFVFPRRRKMVGTKVHAFPPLVKK